MRPSIIEVSELTFDYPGFRALDRVSLSIAPGTVTALVGPNGAGKTTLLRCIAALETPLSGTIRVAGLDVFESPREVHRLMGYLSDNFGLYHDLTVAQGLEYAARSQGLAAAAVPQAVQSTAHRLGLGDKLHTLGGALSHGQRQRLAIGQAIIHAPQVLLLDEPASGLDPEARGALAQVFLELQAQGMTLLVSSHILAELDAYSTHMLALNQGRVLEHRALNHVLASEAGDRAERMLRLEFMEPAASVAPWLQAQANIRLGRMEGHGLEIGLVGGASAQASLVAACVAAGHHLTVIAPITENLQQSYLKSLAVNRATEHSARTQA
ncbi:MAG: ABC transporter ATP-binding protein [Rhodoferax sp.]|nr:ABC transporter ATP-binding protein [Rhodoferax sp.]MDP3650814.1 ABC transporter ATP-binding protein [Rhodoferax sp.]